MADSGIVIPYEISKILNDRAGLWQRLDEAQRQFDELDKLDSLIKATMLAQLPPELTSEKTPPAEIAAALKNIQAELARIDKSQESIRAYQAEIKFIEKKQLITVIVVGVIMVFILGAIVFGGIAIINSMMENFSG
jgi:hypothetical protein